jgi:hypothetical protein
VSILKLKEVGDEAYMTVEDAEVVEGQYGQQFKFSGGGDDLYLPYDSALRQFDRLGLTEHGEPNLGAIKGQTLHFSRTASSKPGAKPYWNINAAGLPKKPAPTHPKSAPPAFSNKPNADLPEFLRDAEAQTNAELQGKIGFDVSKIQQELALYKALTEFVAREIMPIYVAAEVGMSPESAAASVQTLFINLTGGKK